MSKLRDLLRCMKVDLSGTRKIDHEWHRLLAEDMSNQDYITVGVDEVGNGALFGPIMVAAVTVLTGWKISGIKDSKQIKNEKKRKVLAGEIRHNCVWTLGQLSAAAIDTYGAGPCLTVLTEQVIEAHVARLRESIDKPIHVILDGEGDDKITADYRLIREPKADAKWYEVSAASILAKSTRDDWCREAVEKNPLLIPYKIESNKGYGTEAHEVALVAHGLTEHHRRGACETFLDNGD
jgi:ribonuclease HII